LQRLIGLLLVAAACAKQRPPTAIDYCNQLAKKFIEGKTECSAVGTEDKGLLMAMNAIEAAQMMRADAKKPIAYVAYRLKVEPDSVGAIVQAAGQALFAQMLSAENAGAQVAVFVQRGEIAAAKFEALEKDVAGLAARN
jgi:hypothetical protein